VLEREMRINGSNTKTSMQSSVTVKIWKFSSEGLLLFKAISCYVSSALTYKIEKEVLVFVAKALEDTERKDTCIRGVANS
jgi:hypothetical protein